MGSNGNGEEERNGDHYSSIVQPQMQQRMNLDGMEAAERDSPVLPSDSFRPPMGERQVCDELSILSSIHARFDRLTSASTCGLMHAVFLGIRSIRTRVKPVKPFYLRP